MSQPGDYNIKYYQCLLCGWSGNEESTNSPVDFIFQPAKERIALTQQGMLCPECAHSVVETQDFDPS